jgi:hypothetical protein
MTGTPAHFVRIRVGGEDFEASIDTLLNYPGSIFEALLSSRWRDGAQDALVFDRDPRRFRVILNFMRTGELVLEDGVSAQGARQEADFFQVDAAVEAANALLSKEEGATLLHISVDPRRGKLVRLDSQGEVAVLSAVPVALGRTALIAIHAHVGSAQHARVYVHAESSDGSVHKVVEHVGEGGSAVRALARLPAGRHTVRVCAALEPPADAMVDTPANSPHRTRGSVLGPARAEVWRFPCETGVASWVDDLDPARPAELATGKLREWHAGGAPLDAASLGDAVNAISGAVFS